MAEFSARAPDGPGPLRQVAAWMGAAVVYGAAQGLSAWVARYAQGRGTRPQYEQFERPAFAPPGAVFPVVWSALNLTTATSAWLVWRAGEAEPGGLLFALDRAAVSPAGGLLFRLPSGREIAAGPGGFSADGASGDRAAQDLPEVLERQGSRPGQHGGEVQPGVFDAADEQRA